MSVCSPNVNKFITVLILFRQLSFFTRKKIQEDFTRLSKMSCMESHSYVQTTYRLYKMFWKMSYIPTIVSSFDLLTEGFPYLLSQLRS